MERRMMAWLTWGDPPLTRCSIYEPNLKITDQQLPPPWNQIGARHYLNLGTYYMVPKLGRSCALLLQQEDDPKAGERECLD